MRIIDKWGQTSGVIEVTAGQFLGAHIGEKSDTGHRITHRYLPRGEVVNICIRDVYSWKTHVVLVNIMRNG